jgi:hypothetical protein
VIAANKKWCAPETSIGEKNSAHDNKKMQRAAKSEEKGKKGLTVL